VIARAFDLHPDRSASTTAGISKIEPPGSISMVPNCGNSGSDHLSVQRSSRFQIERKDNWNWLLHDNILDGSFARNANAVLKKQLSSPQASLGPCRSRSLERV